MFIPASFRADDVGQIHDFIESNSFAVMVSPGDKAELVATHIPLLLNRKRGQYGTLEGHLARANDQWQQGTEKVLTIFHGPHAYISPNWYAAERVVPTWNYVAVHAYGSLELIEEEAEVLDLLRRTMTKYEGSFPKPWTVERSGDVVGPLLQGIVAFRIPITRLEGKWKLSQNHSPERQQRVINALETQGGENSLEIARLMRENLAS